jgi:hypothetical protein
MNFGNKQPASKLGRSIVTSVATAQTATYFGSQTRHVRLIHTLTGGVWATIDSTGVITANSSAAFIAPNVEGFYECTPGQVLNFLTTSTSTGYVVVTELS